MKLRRYKILIRKVLETKPTDESIKIILEENSIEVSKHKLKKNNIKKEQY